MDERDGAVIEARRLTRYFGGKCAVRELTFSVPRGCIFALLGRNGSGKTTMIRMLLGLLDPTRGSAKVLGHDSRRLPPPARGRIGYLPEGHPVFGWMRVREAGDFQASFHERWSGRVFSAVLDHFGIRPESRARALSRGQRAGLCLALTLAGQPDLLVLDDPALGLDPVARQSLLEAMVHFTRHENRTIFFSSHLLADVERVADRVAVLGDGLLRAHCPLDAFRDRVKQVVLHHRGSPPAVPPIPGLLASRRSEGQLVLTIANMDRETDRVLRSLGVERVEEVEIGLEEAFLGYLGDRGERSFFLTGTGDER